MKLACLPCLSPKHRPPQTPACRHCSTAAVEPVGLPELPRLVKWQVGKFASKQSFQIDAMLLLFPSLVLDMVLYLVLYT